MSNLHGVRAVKKGSKHPYFRELFDIVFFEVVLKYISFEPHHEKTCLRGLQPG